MWEKVRRKFIKEHAGELTRGDYGVVITDCHPVVWDGEEGRWRAASVPEWERACQGRALFPVGVFDPDWGDTIYYVTP